MSRQKDPWIAGATFRAIRLGLLELLHRSPLAAASPPKSKDRVDTCHRAQHGDPAKWQSYCDTAPKPLAGDRRCTHLIYGRS